MNISLATRDLIIREHRSAIAKKAARTLRKRFGKDWFKKQGSKGGSTRGTNPLARMVPSDLRGRERTRMMVRARDKYTCQDCGAVRTPAQAKRSGKKLFDVHHLNGKCGQLSRKYDRIADLDGLILLCHKCHFNRSEHAAKRLNNKAREAYPHTRAHMPDFDKRLKEDFGMKRTTSEWIDAWSLRTTARAIDNKFLE